MDDLLTCAEDFQEWDAVKALDRDKFFKSSSYGDVLQDVSGIQSRQLLTKTMMNLKRLEPFLTGMAHFEKTLTSLKCQHTSRIMSCIWGPIRFLLQTTCQTERAFDMIIDVYERLGYQLPPLYEYMRLFIELPESEACLVFIYEDILMFHKIAYKLFSLRDKLWQRLLRPTWKSLQPTFTHLTESLQRHQKFITNHGLPVRNDQVNLEEDEQSLWFEPGLYLSHEWDHSKMHFNRYRNDLKWARDEFERKNEESREESKRKVLAWVSASKKTEALHKTFQDMRICQDTGRWVFKRYSGILDWITGVDPPPESTIWLHGTKGYGKTVLASLIIDELSELRTEHKKFAIPQDSKIYYFYCQGQDPETCNHLEVLKGILHQMIADNEELLPLCFEKSESSGDTILTDTGIVKSLIEAFFEYNRRQYVIIDGLNECDMVEVKQVSEFFMSQVVRCDNEIKQGQLRVLFVSQKVPELVKFMPEEDACIELRARDNADDIRAYVRERISDFSVPRTTSSGFNLSESDKTQIESIICHRSEDMFLYAHLAIEYLLQQPTRGRLREKIREEMLPKELSKMYSLDLYGGDPHLQSTKRLTSDGRYEKIIGQVKAELLELEDGEKQWEMAKVLLGWLVCANRPLKWHEMQSILSYDHTTQNVDFGNKMLRDKVHKYLGSLIHVLDGEHICLIHSTARLHIVENEHINAQAVECDLAILCLRYLCLPCFSTPIDDGRRKYMGQKGWFSFQDYVCSQWHIHINKVIMTCRDLFNSQLYEEKFGFALQSFIDEYQTSFTATWHEDLEQTTTGLSSFAGLTFYENLGIVWNHIFTHQKCGNEIRNTMGILQLDQALEYNRRTLENFAPDLQVDLADTIQDYYGPNLFKCKRTMCKFFYVGYDKAKDREAHHKRHDRPFQCPAHCQTAPIGFSSNKDRDRHVRLYHPELSEGPSIFEAFSRKVGSANYRCELCSRSFTRKDNLKAHTRSHFGERPYACSNCGKAFGRLNDCRRHERIHVRRGE